MAVKYFELVGSSQSECDTIPGRQSMASFHILSKSFDDVLIYLESIKEYVGLTQSSLNVSLRSKREHPLNVGRMFLNFVRWSCLT